MRPRFIQQRKERTRCTLIDNTAYSQYVPNAPRKGLFVVSRRTPATGTLIVAKAAELMYAQVDRFAHLASLVMGKLINEARGEVKFSADILAYYAPSQSPNRYCRGRESESSLVVVCAKILGAEHKSSSTARQHILRMPFSKCWMAAPTILTAVSWFPIPPSTRLPRWTTLDSGQ